MSDVLSALGLAFRGLLHPRMWLLMIWPMALAILIWGVLGLLFGAAAVSTVQRWLDGSGIYRDLTALWPISIFAAILIHLLMLAVFVPLVLGTASLIIGVAGMPVIVRHVAARDYPGLLRRPEGGFAASLGNAAVALAGLAGLALLTLPLWAVPPLWPFIPLGLVGWFNQRLFRYDALAEHATRDEVRTILDRNSGKCGVLGVLLAVIGHVPLLGFFMPVLGGLAFAHFGLEKLAALRAAPIEVRQ